MYPDCPYHAAWKPGSPAGTRAGAGMPGPTEPAHVAAAVLAGAIAPKTSITRRSAAFTSVITTDVRDSARYPEEFHSARDVSANIAAAHSATLTHQGQIAPRTKTSMYVR